jgi:uncharacterized radical SAM superfamily Fe-S cluster-containing enzyme
LRDDLPELIAYGRELGCRYIQINSNGLRLAHDERYVEALAKAGLSFVFMQFDGVGDDIYLALRGAPLYEQKRKAISMCDKYHIGVALVPTIVPGVNDNQVGEIIRFGASMSPAVRGVHFQPVSYLGKYPALPWDEHRLTLDGLLSLIEQDAGIGLSSLLPSRCDHPLCGFHGNFLVNGESLVPLSSADSVDPDIMTTAEQNREYIGRKWTRQVEQDSESSPGIADCCCDEEANCCDDECCGEDDRCCDDGFETFDAFLSNVRKHGFTISGMAFQDAMNLDIERLRRCSLRVYDEGVLKPFCAAYLTPMK